MIVGEVVTDSHGVANQVMDVKVSRGPHPGADATDYVTLHARNGEGRKFGSGTILYLPARDARRLARRLLATSDDLDDA